MTGPRAARWARSWCSVLTSCPGPLTVPSLDQKLFVAHALLTAPLLLARSCTPSFFVIRTERAGARLGLLAADRLLTQGCRATPSALPAGPAPQGGGHDITTFVSATGPGAQPQILKNATQKKVAACLAACAPAERCFQSAGDGLCPAVPSSPGINDGSAGMIRDRFQGVGGFSSERQQPLPPACTACRTFSCRTRGPGPT